MWSELLGAVKLVLAMQASQATVAGTIRDQESGAPLDGAVVALTDLDRAVVSDASGSYRLDGVPPGPQHLSVKHIGVAPRTVHALVPGPIADHRGAFRGRRAGAQARPGSRS
jgi:hypothetical protein